jgi:hypothetical protein
MVNLGIMAKCKDITEGLFASNAIPVRKGARPKTLIGPLHIQCNGHGDPKYLKRLVDDVLTWPHIEPRPSVDSPPDTIPIRIEEMATSSDSSAFISDREFARVLLGAATIYLALPLASAHRAIVRWLGRATLPSVFRINAGGRCAGVCTHKSRGTGRLLFPLRRSVPFCL